MTTKNPAAVALGRNGGKKSVAKRFGGLTKEEISQRMREVRLAKRQKKIN